MQAAQAAMVQEYMAKQLMQVAEQQERAVDEKIAEMENMTEDDLEKLREKRLEQMKAAQKLRAKQKMNGHGEYTELPDQQQFFDAMKVSKRLVVHFYRPSTELCSVVDARFREMAPKYMGTRFLKINAEKSPYLCEKLNIFMMPTLLLVKDQKVVHHIRGFDEFGGTPDFSTDWMAYILSNYDVLFYEGAPPDGPTESAGFTMERTEKSAIKQSIFYGSDDEEC